MDADVNLTFALQFGGHVFVYANLTCAIHFGSHVIVSATLTHDAYESSHADLCHASVVRRSEIILVATWLSVLHSVRCL